MARGVRLLAPAGVFLLGACAVDDGEPEAARLGVARTSITVAEAADAGCSTLSVKGLSLQIIAQSNCISPGAFLEVPAQPNVTVQDTVFPFLEAPAREALVAAVTDNPELAMTVNSMLRTVAQQYLLYRWYQGGTCGIALAATPGSSNHETGLALDISQPDAWRPILEHHGFTWLGSSDPVHFDYDGPGAVDHRSTDVLAFQMLWNLNHPEDPIDEDGAWGPQTQARMEQAPAEGFPRGASCADAPDVWITSDVVGSFDRFADGASADVPDVFESDALDWVVVVENHGDAPAESVVVALEADVAIGASAFTIERASARGAQPTPAGGGSFNGQTVEVSLGPLGTGEIAYVHVDATAAGYSVERDDPPSLRAFVREVAGHYEASAFGGEVANDGTQTFGGGRLEAASPIDVYSHLRWELDSDRREGMTGPGALAVVDGALELAPQEGAYVMTPVTSIAGNATTTLSLRARRAASGKGEAAVLLFSDDDVDLQQCPSATCARVPIAIPADGAFHDVTLDTGDAPLLGGLVRRIAFVPFEHGAGEAALDALRVESATIDGKQPPAGGAQPDASSCGCEVPARSGNPSGGATVPLGLLLLLARRQRTAAARAPMRRAA